ncbi:ribbon-helix-helix protein, CopG family [Roseospira visakhapatnamensis]|uniref:Putative DNA-binding protein n=1 Tax=Roseospira visakhapatnamensis TaxID=390880 RepID=A0A7W6REL7_9PROT|nr:ribbon-helix-helix protein, CopG family [Roseospira visakhapatnamensis]MBB4266940.1 putative DNA-binding protein [Roseospira visakhapatnamensis]
MTHTVPMTANVPQALLDRLTSLAERTGRSSEECLVQAIGEFCDTWEDYHKTVDQLLREDDRRLLRVANT